MIRLRHVWMVDISCHLFQVNLDTMSNGYKMIETHRERKEAERVQLFPNTELSFKAVASVAQ